MSNGPYDYMNTGDATRISIHGRYWCSLSTSDLNHLIATLQQARAAHDATQTEEQTDKQRDDRSDVTILLENLCKRDTRHNERLAAIEARLTNTEHNVLRTNDRINRISVGLANVGSDRPLKAHTVEEEK